MPTIKLLDIIGSPNAILHKFGMQVFEAIDNLLSQVQQEKVLVSFEGLHNLTSGFMNAAFGNLYKKHGPQLDEILCFGIPEEDWKEKLADARTLALEPEKAQILDEAIADLFD